ncbi:MAG TPA: SDR family NAD(P)-dependent oxidoreductase [Gemmatimonadaceae bacterium]
MRSAPPQRGPFAAEDACVVLSGRNHDALDVQLQAVKWDGHRAIAVAADCTDPASLAHLRAETERAFGPADILLAFAGGDGSPEKTHAVSPTRFTDVVNTNLNSTFFTIHEFLPGMLERKRGTIVTMASAAARQPALSSAAYAAAKGGVITLTRHLAREYGPSGIRVNCIAPSAILNERMESALSSDQIAEVGRSFPLGRVGQPEDVAEAALYLASDTSSWVTGVVLDVAGGKIMV